MHISCLVCDLWQDTHPNPALYDPVQGLYRPAHMLLDPTVERAGRGKTRQSAREVHLSQALSRPLVVGGRWLGADLVWGGRVTNP